MSSAITYCEVSVDDEMLEKEEGFEEMSEPLQQNLTKPGMTEMENRGTKDQLKSLLQNDIPSLTNQGMQVHTILANKRVAISSVHWSVNTGLKQNMIMDIEDVLKNKPVCLSVLNQLPNISNVADFSKNTQFRVKLELQTLSENGPVIVVEVESMGRISFPVLKKMLKSIALQRITLNSSEVQSSELEWHDDLESKNTQKGFWSQVDGKGSLDVFRSFYEAFKVFEEAKPLLVSSPKISEYRLKFLEAPAAFSPYVMTVDVQADHLQISAGTLLPPHDPAPVFVDFHKFFSSVSKEKCTDVLMVLDKHNRPKLSILTKSQLFPISSDASLSSEAFQFHMIRSEDMEKTVQINKNVKKTFSGTLLIDENSEDQRECSSGSAVESLEIHEYLCLQQTAPEKQTDFLETLQELLDDLSESENRLNGHQQQVVPANSEEENQQRQVVDEALLKDLRWNNNALNATISSAKKFLEERHCELNPEQTSSLETKLKELTIKTNTFNQKAEGSGRFLENEPANEKKDAVELQNTKRMLLDVISNAHEEKDKAGTQKEPLDRKKGKTLDQPRIPETGDPNGNPVETTEASEDSECDAVDQQHYRPKACHQELFSPQQDLMITPPALGFLGKKALITNLNGSITPAELQAQTVQKELCLFQGDCREFEVWLEQNQRIVEDLRKPSGDLLTLRNKLQNQRVFSEDVASREEDLHFVTISGQMVLDAARTPDGSPMLDLPATRAEVKDKLENIAGNYSSLQEECKQLGSDLEDVVHQYTAFQESRSSLVKWLNETEAESRRKRSEVNTGDPEASHRQLDETKSFLRKMEDHQASVETLRKAAEALVRNCGEMLSNQEEIRETVVDIFSRFDELLSSAEEHSKTLQMISTEISLKEKETVSWMEESVKNKPSEDQARNVPQDQAQEHKFVENSVRTSDKLLDVEMLEALSPKLNEASERLSQNISSLEKLKYKVAEFDLTAEKVLEFVQKNSQTNQPRIDVTEISRLIWDTNEVVAANLQNVETLWELCEEIHVLASEVSVENNVLEKIELTLSCRVQSKEFKEAVEVFLHWLDSLEKQSRSPESFSEEILGSELEKVHDLVKEWSSKAPTVQEINDKGSFLCRMISSTSLTTTKWPHTPEEQNTSFINKSYRLVGELLNVRSSELSLLLNTPAEVHEQADSLNQWPQETNQAKTQWENCLSGKDGVELQAEPQKALKESGTHKQEKLHELTENPDSPSWRQMSPQTDGVLGTEKMEESTHMLDFLHSTLPQLSQWLHEKEMMFSVLGPLSTDSNMLDMQKQQVEILQKEFESRGVQYEKLNQVCSALAVEGMLEFVSQKWQALTEQLSDRLCLIDQVLERCSHFKELVTSLGERKNILEKELEQKLVLPNVSEENAQQIEDVSVILDQLRHEEVRLKEAELLFLELSAIVTEENLRSDLRNQLESIRKQFSHLEDKAGKHIECLHSARTTSQQFYQTLDHFQAWIKQTVEEQGELLPICADVDLLKDKISENASIQNSITENERLFNTVMSEGEALLQSTAGSSKVPVQTQLSALRSSWLDVRRNNEEQEKKLGEALQKAMGYQQCVRKIDLRLYDYKNKLENVRFCMSLVENERYLTEVNAMQTDLERQSEWVEMKEATESLLNVLPVDNDVVREEMVNMSEALEKLTRELKLKKQSLENIDQNLKEFNNLQKETEVLLDGARKKLQSDSAMDLQANTSLNLTSLKALQSSLKALHNPIERIQELAQDLAKAFPDADGIANLHLQADNLRKDHIILCERAEDVCSTLEDKLQDIIQLQNSVGEMFARFTDLDDELDGMVPVGRDLDTVCDQQRTMKVFRDVLQEVISKTAIERERCSRLLEVEELPDLLGLKRDVETLCKKCAKLMGRAIIRDNHVEETLVHLQEFYSKMHEFTEALKAAENQETFTGSFELKTESIKQQLESIKTEFESLSSKFQDVHSLSLGLIQNASAGTTRRLEDDFELVKTKWNVLNNKLAERSSHLHEALLHCGTFQDALDSFLSWMTDTEELMANQKPPSAEFRVVKAQIEEQKLLQRVLEDRRATVELIMMEGRKLTVLADAVDQENVAREMRCLCERWDVLVRNAEKRKQQLESILLVAKQFHETLEPLTAWLTVTEKSLANSEPLGTQILKLQEQISQHETLKECVMERGETLLQALSLGEALQSLCCVEDQEFVRTSLENTRRSFAELRRRCGLRSELLKQAGRFHADATELASWLEDVDNRLRSFSVQDCECSVLAEQHVELVALHGQIEMRKPDVEKTTRNGLELMKQTTGDDAAVLQRRLDELKTQYSEISRTSLKASNTLQKALSLATKLADGRTELEVWMETVQVRLKEAEEQTVDGEQLRHLQRRQNASRTALMEEVKNQKPLVESLKQVSSALMDLVPWKAREGLDKLVSGDLERYRWASEAVTQRAQQTDAAIWKFQQFEKAASSELAWLTEAEKKLSSLCEVSLDLQQASAQLQAQKAFSLEVMRHKDAVDDIVKTGEAFMNNRDEVKLCLLVEKSAAVGELNSERCLHLDKSHSLVGRFWETHDDLWQWLLESGASFARLSQPALEFEMLQEQQENLRQMRERIAEHKPHVGKMNKIALGLVELSPTEAPVIREKVQAVEQLYSQLRADVNRQASALEEAISKYSQFHTKIGPMLETLELIVERLHRPLSISGEVEKIQEQICDNRAVTVNLDRLQPSYETLKQRGEEIIACSEGPDPAAKVVQDKLDQMLVQWRDIQALLEEREARLLDVLDVADKYWCDLCSVSSAIVALQDRVKALEEPGVDPSVVKQQQESLEDFREELTGLQEELNVVRNLGAELLTACGDPDKVVIKKSMEEVKAAWEGLNKTWTERVEMLEDAMQAAVQFEDSLQNMFDALEILDVKLNSLSSVASELETVKQQIEELKEFKKEAYHLLMEMERLRSQAGILLKKEVTESDRLFILDPLREIQSFWDSLDQKMTSRQHKLERALLALGQHQLALDELLAWLSHTEDLLGDQRKPCCHPKAIEIELAKHHVLQNDVLAHRSTVEAISKAGNELKTCVDREELSGLQHKLENLQHRWERILQKTEDRRQLLRDALQEAQGFHGEIEAMQNWLKDTERRLPSSVGGLPDTVLQQLNTHLVLCCALEAKEESFKKVLQRGQQVLAMSNESPDGTTALSLRNLQESWQFVQVKVSERRVKLEEAQAVTTDFQNSLLTFITWLTEAELTLTTASPVSLLLETATFQRDEHRAFETEMNLQRKHLVELDKTGSQLQYFSEKQDAVMIKNLLLDVQERWEQLVQQSSLRGNLLEDARKSAKLFYDTWSKLLQCLDEAEKELDSELEITNDPEKVKMQLVRHKEFQKVLGSRISMYDSTRRAGRNLRDETKLVEDKQKLEDMLSELRDRWDTVCGKSVERQNKLEEALLFSGQFTEALQVLLDWLFMVETRLAEDQFVHGDIDLVLNLIDSHKVFQKELSKRTGNLRALKLRAREMIESSHVDSSWVTVQIEELNTHWETVCSLSLSKQTRLEDALFQADEFHSSVRALLEWLAQAEQNLRFTGSLPDDDEQMLRLIHQHQEIMDQLEEKRLDLTKATSMGETILSTGHPDAISSMKNWIAVINARFQEVSVWARQHQQKLSQALEEHQASRVLLEDLMLWLQWAETTLTEKDGEPPPQDLQQVKRLIDEHQTFMEEMTRKQPDVDKITKTLKRRSADHTCHSQIPVLCREQARNRFPVRSMSNVSENKNPKVKLLVSRWQQVWLQALERRRKLNEVLENLEEIKEFSNFDFDVWRKRYMHWMNHKKSRVMDFFRRMDKDQDGRVTRKEFIEGILSSKFPTSRLEVSAVADIFDRNSDGYIDYYEFVAALHPNKDAYKPLTEDDKIEDEVTRQVAKCKCPKRFQVEQIGANKYRFYLGNQFGDSQQLRLVRILRSTVMVRVGGGWMALDEFLVKNDPCRVHHHGSKMLCSESNSSIAPSAIAKGRTNVELREKLILPEGTTQVMASFCYRGRRSRPTSRGTSPNRSRSSQAGPPQVNPPSSSFTKTSHLSRNYDKPWLTNSKTAASFKSSESFDKNEASHEKSDIHSSKLRLPGYLSGKAFHAVEDRPSIRRTHTIGSRKILSQSGSGCSSQRDSDASDFDISDIQSLSSDVTESVSGQRRSRRSRIPTPKNKTTPISKVPRSSLL